MKSKTNHNIWTNSLITQDYWSDVELSQMLLLNKKVLEVIKIPKQMSSFVIIYKD